MESLIEQLASELKAKWVQLYSRLGLGPRDRYRFITDHQDEPKDEKERNCARDTIRCSCCVLQIIVSTDIHCWFVLYTSGGGVRG